MPFFRCVLGEPDSGGSDNYVYAIDGNNKEYFKVSAQGNMFSSYDFNSEVFIGNQISSLADMFSGSYSYNCVVNIPNSVTNIRRMFDYCSIYNKPLNIPNSVVDASSVFYRCSEFNQPIIFPDSINLADGTFDSCSKFNSMVVFSNHPDGIIVSGLLSSCGNFNKPLKITNSRSASSMCERCTNFNSPVLFDCYDFIYNTTFGAYSLVTSYAFEDCFEMSSNIIFNIRENTVISDVASMLAGRNTGKRINIYSNNLVQLSQTQSWYSVVGETITWDSYSDGYYNASYNIY